jgi:hypothetical protein
MVVEALDQIEQVSRRRLFMRHDRRQEARTLDCLVIVPRRRVGAHAFLTGLQDDDANAAGLCPLLLNICTWLDDDQVCANGRGEIWVERFGQAAMERRRARLSF